MPRPEPKFVSFEIDGREVSAPEGAMLVDGAKYGDVEIPVFCYEPKLGAPVGACRMCLVEIEGIPKLQTACSTPVKDGMVVTTTSDRVKNAQNAVVEFLLVNHPLDCPVCDKGGECPLQDITFGWGAGRSRFIEPKRHFKKPLELSPLVHIDRERCILCYRCVRFSQEIAEDYQLVLVERGDHTFVGTHDGHPYVGPFSGNITQLCPVGALLPSTYRFRARPWDIESAGTVCTMCPSQCNVDLTVRDDKKVLRVMARDNTEVDDGWLCDKGRYGFQAFHAPERITEPMVRDGGELRPVSWERAVGEAVKALDKAGEKAAAIVGGSATNEEGFLTQFILRDVLGSPHVDSRLGGTLDPEQARQLARPDLSAQVSDLDYAGAILVLGTELVDEAAILDLRVRKAVRRREVPLVVATSRPSSLDPNAAAVLRYAPGAEEALIGALVAELGGGEAAPAAPAPAPDEGEAPSGAEGETSAEGEASSPSEGGASGWNAVRFQPEPARAEGESPAGGATDSESSAGEQPSLDPGLFAERAGVDPEAIATAAAALRGKGPIVVLWGERVTHGARGEQATQALLALTRSLGLSNDDGAGMIEIPTGTNGRGLREVGCVPNMKAGLTEAETNGHDAAGIAGALGEEVSALILFEADPLRTHPNRGAWERGLDAANTVIAFSHFADDTVTRHADVVFPAQVYAEKEGTITHPDGRVQRLRTSVKPAEGVRPGQEVLLELLSRLSGAPFRLSPPQLTSFYADTIPFYRGLTVDEIGARGLRWQDRDAAGQLAQTPLPGTRLEEPPELPDGLRLGTVPSLWASAETDHAAALRFLAPIQRADIAPADAERLGVGPGDLVEVAANGNSVRATAALRSAVAEGSVFLIEGTTEDNATELANGSPRTVEIRKIADAAPAEGPVTDDPNPAPRAETV
jgi:NADH-quinone oxidoreductase subunit G